MKKERALTGRQRAFVQEYPIDLDATNAARRAGYKESQCLNASHEILGNPRVYAEIRKVLDAREKRTNIRADFVLAELYKLASVDLAEAFDEHGCLKPIREIPEAVRKAVSGIETEELWGGKGDEREAIGRIRKLRFWEKTKALELLGKHLALFIDRQSFENPDGTPLFSGEVVVKLIKSDE